MIGTTSTGHPPTIATLEQLKAVMDDLNQQVCPIAKLMIKEGFDPKDGCVIVFPISMRAELGSCLPKYANYSSLINAPMMMRIPKEFL
jgi:hypothetical protein